MASATTSPPSSGLARWAPEGALAAGALVLLSAILFGAFLGGFSAVGVLSDVVGTILYPMAFVPVILALHRGVRGEGARGASAAVAVVGWAGVLVTSLGGVLVLLTVGGAVDGPALVGVEDVHLVPTAGAGLLGLWLAAASVLADLEGVLPREATWPGSVGGVAQFLVFPLTFLLGVTSEATAVAGAATVVFVVWWAWRGAPPLRRLVS